VLLAVYSPPLRICSSAASAPAVLGLTIGAAGTVVLVAGLGVLILPAVMTRPSR